VNRITPLRTLDQGQQRPDAARIKISRRFPAPPRRRTRPNNLPAGIEFIDAQDTSPHEPRPPAPPIRIPPRPSATAWHHQQPALPLIQMRKRT